MRELPLSTNQLVGISKQFGIFHIHAQLDCVLSCSRLETRRRCPDPLGLGKDGQSSEHLDRFACAVTGLIGDFQDWLGIVRSGVFS